MRVFLSFHIPEDIAESIFNKLKSIEGFKPYPTNTLHITLKFIGDIENSQVFDGINKIVSKFKAPITLKSKEFFIEDNRLRVSIYPNTQLLQLQAEICTYLHQNIENLVSQPYFPHVTLGVYEGKSLDIDAVDLFDLQADSFHLYETVPHEGTEPKYEKRAEFKLTGKYVSSDEYKKIILPTRPQPDTIVAIYILKKLGAKHFPKIGNATYESTASIIEDEETLLGRGEIPLDIGGNLFDHHNKINKTTASSLVSSYLGEKDNLALSKILQYAERDDFYGKGTISQDPIDRMVGLSGIIGSLNKKFVNNPEIVVDTVLPLLDSIYEEEEKRAFEMPKELEEKIANGRANTFVVRQRGKKLKCIFIETDNISMAGFLRSRIGGGFDVVALKLSSGHINILTRPAKRIDLRSLAVFIRIKESEAHGVHLDGNPRFLSNNGSLKEVPNWYYDTATNSLLNGGPNPQEIEPTQIEPMEFIKILEVGLAEQLWSPIRGR